MSNNLQKLAKDLRAFAKRCKDIKYTRALLFVFLLTGLLSMAAPADNVETARKDLNTSITDMKKLFREAKQENNKLMKGSNLELIQLMEQGDHVVKTPWSSWQYGMNYFYSDWRGTYKGRGDKSKENLNLARKTDPLERFKFSSQMSATYGTTSLDLVYEPPREVEVSAGIRPKEVNKQAPTFVPSEPSGSLPPFEPKIIQPPKDPDDITITPPDQVNANLTGDGANPEVHYYYWNGNRGAISQVTLTAGTFDINPGGKINVNGYAASAYPGTNPQGTAPTDGEYTINQEFFHTLLNVPYSEYSEGVTINSNRDDFSLINLETQGIVVGDLSNRVTDRYITSTKKDRLKSYQTYSQIKGTDSSELLFINKGTVNLNGKNSTYLFTTSHTDGGKRTNYLDNEGTISANGEGSVIIKHSPDTSQAKAWIYSNNGIMKAEGKNSVVYGAAYSYLEDGRAAFINDGIIEVTGESAIGVILPKDSNNSKLADGHLVWLKKSISLKGTKSIGFVAQNTNISNEKNLVKFEIDATKAIGIFQDVENAGTAKTAGKIEIGGNSSESIGIYANQGTLELKAPHADSGETESSIELKSGSKNIGIYAKGGSTVNFAGVAKITGGEGQKIALATAGSTIKLKEAVVAGDKATNNFVKNAVPLYAVDTNSKINVEKPDLLKFYLSGDSTAVYAKTKGTINMDRTALPSETDGPNIHIKGENNKGIGLFTKDGGVINAKKNYIKVENGSTGISSIGVNGTSKSTVHFEGGKLDYDGEGYALYAKDGGEIKFSNGDVILRGKSTAMELNATGTNPIDISNTKITVMSNDVIVFNLLNVAAPINVSNLSGTINGLVGAGVDVQPGTEGGQTFNKYKLAALDGGTMNIDVDINKADGSTTVSGYYFQRFLGQRLITNVNSNVTARLTTAQANDLYNNQVVGIEANSSKNATNNAQTQVNIASGKILDVARTDGTDKGGIGVFINYGKAKNEGTISIEKDGTANSDAVGIYSVNGSEVTNEGTVDVSGDKGIGILGMAYRTDTSSNPIINEFGTAAVGQGQTNILNKGEVTLDGANAIGIYVKNNNSTATRTTATGTNDTTGVITMSGVSSTGMSGDKATLENKGTININGQKSVGMFAKNSSELKNSRTINLVDGLSGDDPNIGMYTSDDNTKIINDKDIIGGNNTYGIYGKKVDLNATGKIKVGDNSVGIYSNGQHATGLLGSTIHLASGSKIEVGNNQSVGVFTTGTNQIIGGDADMQIGDGSYGYVIKGTGTQLDTNVASGVTLGNDAVYVYSSDTTGNIRNNTELTATGSKNYGIYAAGTVTNLANINFGTGVGNVGMYSIGGGTATNGSATVHPTITVSGSDTINKLYGIGMAAGYVNNAGTLVSTGNVVNHGTIKVEKDNGIGMFATGSGSTATNYGTIELSGKKTTGMYLDNNAVGYNYGTITTVPNPTNDGITGVVASNGAIIKNYGTINIVDGSNLTGVFINKGTKENNYDDQIPGGGTGVLNGPIEVKKQSATGKTVAGINIVAPGNGTATIYRDGAQVIPVAVDTNRATPKPATVNVGTTPISLTAVDLATPSLGQASSIGMYVDTSGVNYTNPIQGLNKLTGLQKVDLFFGTEASKYTNEKDIEVGKNILKPYNDVISTLSSGTSIKFSFASGSLTWIATATQNTDDTLKSLYLSKIPYTSFSSESNTNKFLDGLEQRYGVEGIGTREKALFDKLNGIGKGEAALFAQAVDQMKGHQYSNVQQRIQATGNVLNKEFDYLRNSWSNSTKDSNKIKVFGNRGEYNTDTAGVIDYVSNAYGVAYVHENETVKLGNSSGWYAGAVTNRFKFKDIGKSTENQTMLKLGIFKTMSPVADHNGSLQWTISGEGYVARNAMHRKYLVVDDIFNAKSDYTTYGVAVKNELGYNIRTSERTSIRPYGSLKLEYGRFTSIKEKSGEIRLEVEGNDYYSVKPEVGIEFKYKQPMAVRTTFVTTLGLGYENELGRVGNVKNKARVAYTNADWFNIRGEKDDRKGNFKADLNIGVENQRFGVTFNAGYDTKGHNVRGGLGFRVIY